MKRLGEDERGTKWWPGGKRRRPKNENRLRMMNFHRKILENMKSSFFADRGPPAHTAPPGNTWGPPKASLGPYSGPIRPYIRTCTHRHTYVHACFCIRSPDVVENLSDPATTSRLCMEQYSSTIVKCLPLLCIHQQQAVQHCWRLLQVLHAVQRCLH